MSETHATVSVEMLQEKLEEDLGITFDAFTVIPEKDIPGWATMIMQHGDHRLGANFKVGRALDLAKLMAGIVSYWSAVTSPLTEEECEEVIQ